MRSWGGKNSVSQTLVAFKWVTASIEHEKEGSSLGEEPFILDESIKEQSQFKPIMMKKGNLALELTKRKGIKRKFFTSAELVESTDDESDHFAHYGQFYKI